MSIQAAVTMGQLQQKMDLIGNNMANSSTTGYKSRNADFQSLLFQQIDHHLGSENESPRLTPDGIRVGAGAALGSTNSNLSQGQVQDTGRDLDVALLEKNQLFQIQTTNDNGETETQYTRAGNFYLSPQDNGEVMLTTSNGHPVVGANGDPIVLEDGFESLNINKDGSIETTRNGQSQQEAQLAIVQAVRPRVLEAVGENNFRIPEDAGVAADEIIEELEAGTVEVKSKALEGSNVDLSQQMTDLLTTQRAYQFNARSISTSDEMSGLINQLR